MKISYEKKPMSRTETLLTVKNVKYTDKFGVQKGDSDTDIIVTGGFQQTDNVQEIAEQYPDKVIGFVGGMENTPSVDDFLVGYIEGAQAVDPEIKVVSSYVNNFDDSAKGNYAGSPLEEVLPVTLKSGDDRVELPQGYQLTLEKREHPIIKNIPETFPYILRYNQLKAKENAVVLAKRNSDPLISVMECGKGRTLAYATDCSPHWASKELCEWEYYPILWKNIVKWLANVN